MMFGRKGRKKLTIDSFSNLVAEGTEISGTVKFIGVILVRGKVTGDIIAGIQDSDAKKQLDCISVASTGEVSSSEMFATNIIIEGRVTAKKIWAEDTIKIASTAIITGGATIYCRTIEVETGAVLDDCQIKHLDNCSNDEKPE
jgi:cytoskeletal protein CcmA (bactofilin family)